MRTFVQKQLDIEQAWEDKDISQVRELLHKLIGSSGSYGFNELCEMCQEAIKLPLDETDYHKKFGHFIQKINKQLLSF